MLLGVVDAMNTSAMEMLAEATPVMEEITTAIKTLGVAVKVYTSLGRAGSDDILKWYNDLEELVDKTIGNANAEMIAAVAKSVADVVKVTDSIVTAADTVFSAFSTAQDLMKEITAIDGGDALVPSLIYRGASGGNHRTHERSMRAKNDMSLLVARARVDPSSDARTLDRAVAGKGGHVGGTPCDKAEAAIKEANATIGVIGELILKVNTTLPVALGSIVTAASDALGPASASIIKAIDGVQFLENNEAVGAALKAGIASLGNVPGMLSELVKTSLSSLNAKIIEATALLDPMYGVASDMLEEQASACAAVANVTL